MIAVFAELGWQITSVVEEKFGAGGILERETPVNQTLADFCAVLKFAIAVKMPCFFH